MRSIFVFVFISQLLIGTTFVGVQAQSQDEEARKLEQKIAETERKLSETSKQKNTLLSQLQYLDTQAYIATLRIDETERKIEVTKKEAEILESRIEILDTQLDRQVKAYIESARERYKKRNTTLMDIILSANSASQALATLKYNTKSLQHSQLLVVQTTETKQNFEREKQNREKTRDQLAKLQVELEKQKSSLVRQQEAKRILVAVTRNQESEYQTIIADARRQIAALKNFVATTGLGSIKANSLGGGEGGWYMSQRDERWAGARMGNSSESVLDVGCFITSLAMVLKKYGHDFTPVYFSSNSEYFLPFSAWAYSPANFNGRWPANLRYREIPGSEIDGYLSRDIPVISSVNNQSHYIVLKKKVDGQYIMNDPIYGPDLKVSTYYSLSGRYAVFE